MRYAGGVGAAVVVVGLVTGTAVAVNIPPTATTGTAYIAKAACERRYVQGQGNFTPDVPPNSIDGFVSTGFEAQEESATASVMGLYPSTAWRIPGSGCVVADSRPAVTDPVPPVAERTTPGVPQPVRPFTGPADAAVQRAVAAALDREGSRGVVVVQDGAVVGEGYSGGFDEFTPQRGWSMTKSATNALAGRVAAGAVPGATLSPDDHDLWAGWGEGDERRSISVDNLMRMTPGLEWDESYGLTGDVAELLYHEPDQAAFVADKPLTSRPGTTRTYSTGTTALLCSVLQDRTRMGADMAYRLLYRPLGMASAELEFDRSGGLACGSGMMATPRDWAKFGQFILNDGVVDPDAPDVVDPATGEASPAPAARRLLPRDWLRESFTTHPAGGEGATESSGGTGTAPYGAGWWVNRAADGRAHFPDLPVDMVWADGHDGQYLAVVPSRRLVVVRQGFTPGASFANSGMRELVRDAVAATDTATGGRRWPGTVGAGTDADATAGAGSGSGADATSAAGAASGSGGGWSGSGADATAGAGLPQ
ncbi:serine hydrolase [Corynebacterium bovis]|nr:serine hydrolase [Corynebacterium bovis]